MPGKSSVVVRFIGDTTSLDKAMGKSESSLGRMGGVFSSIGRKIGGEFGELLSTVGESFDKLGEKGGASLGTKLAVGGGAVTGLGVAMQQLGSANKQATDQLNAAIESTGKPLEQFKGRIEETIKAQENLGHSDDDTQTALRKLTQATNDPAVALKNMGLVANLAAAQHISLADAASQVAKIIGGRGARTLAQYGVQTAAVGNLTTNLTRAQHQHTKAVDALAKANEALANKQAALSKKSKLTLADEQALTAAHERVKVAQEQVAVTTDGLATAQRNLANPLAVTQSSLDQLSKKLDGQASASVDNFAGKLGIIKTKLGDWAAQTSEKVGPALTAVGPVLMVLGALVQAGTFGWIKNAAAATASGVATVAAAIAGRVASMAQTVAIVAMYTAQYVAAAASKAWAVAQWLLNAALDANPIGLVVLAIAALVAGLVFAYRHSETFRKIVQGAFRAVGEAGRWLWENQLRPAFALIAGMWLSVVGGIVSGAAAAFGWVPGIGPKLKSAAAKFDEFRDRVNNALKATQSHKTITISTPGSDAAYQGLLNIQAAARNVPKSVSIGISNKLGNIPGFASGTSFAPGGVALVGEKGPELVHLPRGSKVTPNGASPRGDTHITVNTTTASSGSDIAAEIAWLMKTAAA